MHIDAGYTRAYNVVDAINKANAAGRPSCTAGLDPLDDVNGGQGLVEADATAGARNGSGEGSICDPDCRLPMADKPSISTCPTCKTVEDLLNAVNANPGLLAKINDSKDGIDIQSRDTAPIS